VRHELGLDPTTPTPRAVAAAIVNNDGFTALRATPIVPARRSVAKPAPKYKVPPLHPRPPALNGIDWADTNLYMEWHMVHAPDEVAMAYTSLNRHWDRRERAAREIKEAGGDPWALGHTDVDLDVKFEWNDFRADSDDEYTFMPDSSDDDEDDGMAAKPGTPPGPGTSVENAIEVSP